MVKRDKVGEELFIGDWVIAPNANYAELHFKRVEKFTPKKMYVSYRGKKATLVEPTSCVKVLDEDYLARIMLEKPKLFS